MRTLVGTLSLLVLATLGCTSGSDGGSGGSGGAGGAGGSGGSAECLVPNGTNTIQFANMCMQGEPTTNAIVQVEGAFQPAQGGFQVVADQETVQIDGPEPVIPAGTLVRLSYGCRTGFYGDNGAVVQLENVPSINGNANPTEDTSRLWYFMAAGGEAVVPEEFPFTATMEEVCMDGTIEDGFTSPERLTLTGAGFTVTAEPGAVETFTETTGPHAGTYAVDNVRVTWVGYPGGDATFNLNFTVARAD